MTTLFLLMLCNDREVLGPWTNPSWLRVLASLIVGVLVLLSVILTVTTILPSVDVASLSLVGGALLAVAMVGFGVSEIRSRPGGKSAVTILESGPAIPKEQWTMPPAALLSRPRMSTGKHAAMLILGGYMVVALVMLIVKTVQLAGG
jgi:hypothetical protein